MSSKSLAEVVPVKAASMVGQVPHMLQAVSPLVLVGAPLLSNDLSVMFESTSSSSVLCSPAVSAATLASSFDSQSCQIWQLVPQQVFAHLSHRLLFAGSTP